MTIWILLAGLMCAHAQITVQSENQSFFSGDQQIAVTLHNTTNQTVTKELHFQLIQDASDLGVALGVHKVWKPVQLLSNQTALDSIPITFPSVKRETKMSIYCLEPDDKVVGKISVWVFPTNLVQSLGSLVSNTPIGLLDPCHRLKPLFDLAKLHTENIGEGNPDGFEGKLVIIDAFKTHDDVPEALSDSVRALAKHGTAVVWIQTPRKESRRLLPNFQAVTRLGASVIIAQPYLITNIATVPWSQENLITLCQMAVHPVESQLPHP